MTNWILVKWPASGAVKQFWVKELKIAIQPIPKAKLVLQNEVETDRNT